jgi:P27 family predicted phage terminase small subunit
MAGNWNSGRRPQPTALKVLRGNPSKTRLNANEPKPPAVTDNFDIPPPELDGDAMAIAEWTRVAPLLRMCGLVSQAERTALTALCQQWSQYLEAQTHIRKLGMVVKTTNGLPMTNPYLPIARAALAACHRLWTELGLTPSGRARVSRLPPLSDAPAPRSKWAGLL